MRKKRILVVDDEPAVAEATVAVLEFDGHTVETVRSPVAALAKYKRSRYDLIVTDYRMPAMTGLELAERIKAQDAAQPILLLSGTPPDGSPSHVDLVMQKPFSGAELLRATDDLTKGGCQSEEAQAREL